MVFLSKFSLCERHGHTHTQYKVITKHQTKATSMKHGKERKTKRKDVSNRIRIHKRIHTHTHKQGQSQDFDKSFTQQKH